MDLEGKVAVVTGGGSGIGRSLCRRFAAAGARGIVVADVDEPLAREVADEIGGLAVPTDVGVEAQVIHLVEQATARYGAVDLFCSNAGICPHGGPEFSDAGWQRAWHVNVMSHIYAARAVLPAMIARGSGYLLQTASAAGLLTQLGSAPYSVTKHAAVGFAEWLSITYAKDGIKVSCLCPQGVHTDMLDKAEGGLADYLRGSALTAEAVAEVVVEGIAAERFLILPHVEVAEYFLHKGQDYERWLRGMRRLQDKLGVSG